MADAPKSRPFTAEEEAVRRELGVAGTEVHRLWATLDTARAEVAAEKFSRVGSEGAVAANEETIARLRREAIVLRAHLEKVEAERTAALVERDAARADAGEAVASTNEAWRAHANRLKSERDVARAQSERRRQDREDALSVTSTDGLLASEWVLRAGKAKRERDEARAEVTRLRACYEHSTLEMRLAALLDPYWDFEDDGEAQMAQVATWLKRQPRGRVAMLACLVPDGDGPEMAAKLNPLNDAGAMDMRLCTLLCITKAENTVLDQAAKELTALKACCESPEDCSIQQAWHDALDAACSRLAGMKRELGA